MYTLATHSLRPAFAIDQTLLSAVLTLWSSSLKGHPHISACLFNWPSYPNDQSFSSAVPHLRLSSLFGCPISLAVFSLWLSYIIGYPMSSAIPTFRLYPLLGHAQRLGIFEEHHLCSLTICHLQPALPVLSSALIRPSKPTPLPS
jgi:hypothetical protein